MRSGNVILTAMKEVILTGIRSNDEPTLGNYLGAFLPMVELQRQKAGEFQLNMFVPDLHSFTTPIDHDNLYENTLKNLRYFVAAGLNINQPDTYIYRQSFVPAHSELTWILDCFAKYGEMTRMTQFKEKSGIQDILTKIDNFISTDEAVWEKISLNDNSTEDIRHTAELLIKTVQNHNDFIRGLLSDYKKGESVTVGLLNYPVLMAADILLYGAQWVPVGDDQKQHLEITRDIAQRMNSKFGDVFTVPHDWKKQLEFSHRDNGVRIRSLANPEKKMSKSVSDPRGTILLSDDPKDAAKKIMSATTDSTGAVHFDWENQPGVTNLLQILALLSGREQADVNREWEGNERYGDLKKAVAEVVEVFLTDFQGRYEAVDQVALEAKLSENETAMNDVANETLSRVQQAVGLRPRN